MKFTDRYVSNLKPKPARFMLQEENAHGNGSLCLRVSPNGHKAWMYTFHFDGRVRRMTLGAYPVMSVADAHAAYGEAMQLRERGIDPCAKAVDMRVLERAAPTFADLAARYLEEYARKKKRKSADRQDRALTRDVLPAWGPHKAEAIQRKDVRALLKGIEDRGAPIQANRTLALVRKIFNWAIGEDLVQHNPCLGVSAPGEEHQRDRVLTPDEIKGVLAKLPTAAMSEETKLALRLLLLTAQRCGEILAVRWDEIDLAGGWWTIPGAKAKNNLAHRVPLSAPALDVLRQARALNPDRQTVFSSPRADVPMVETAVARAVRRNLEHFKLTDCTPHDLRRTAASHMTGMGIPRLVVSKILNHVEKGVTAVYDRHSYDADKRAALDTWSLRVEELRAAASVEAVRAVADPPVTGTAPGGRLRKKAGAGAALDKAAPAAAPRTPTRRRQSAQ